MVLKCISTSNENQNNHFKTNSMRIKIGKFILLGLLVFGGLSACKKDQSLDTTQSDVVKDYLELRTKMNVLNATTGQMSNFMSVIAASQLHNNMFSLKSMTGDSVVTDSVPPDSSGYWNYWTCATVTETDNGDGTFTTIYDYGDGCDEFGSIIKGKITYIWNNTGNEYYSKVVYERYYCYGMEMNGFSEYTFTSSGDSYFQYDSTDNGKDTAVSPGIVFNWSGTSSGKDNMTVTFDSGETYTYISNFSNRWDNSTYTLLEGEYTYTSEPEGFEYSYHITSPLFYNYLCINTWIAVSGIETIHYNDAVDTYDFIIDYGDGTCDNLATVTENGEASVVDFGELIVIYCGTDASESVTSNCKR